MSSKHAAWRGNKALLLALLTYLSDTPRDRETIAGTQSGVPSQALYDRLRYAQQAGYIQKFGTFYQTAPLGKKILSESRIWELTIPTPDMWNLKWHIATFDIPHDKRKRRDGFRRRLKELGLVLYQNSVWIYPYPFEKIVQQIADFYHLSAYVSFIVAEKVSGEEKLLRHFKLHSHKNPLKSRR